MTAQQIISEVAGSYGITPDQLIHGDKRRIFCDPRHVAAYLLHVRLGLGYSTIRRMLGYKQHGTIIYACQKVADWLTMPRQYSDAVKAVNKVNRYNLDQ